MSTGMTRRRERVPRLGMGRAVGGPSAAHKKRSFRPHGSTSQMSGHSGAGSSSGQSVLRGYLWKRGGGRSALGNKGWKQRWCVLVDGHFCYYESQEAWKKAPTKYLKKPYRLMDCDVLPGEHDRDFDADNGTPIKVKQAGAPKVVQDSFAFRIQPRAAGERAMILRCCDREQRSMWMEQISQSVQFSEAGIAAVPPSSLDRKGSSNASGGGSADGGDRLGRRSSAEDMCSSAGGNNRLWSAGRRSSAEELLDRTPGDFDANGGGGGRSGDRSSGGRSMARTGSTLDLSRKSSLVTTSSASLMGGAGGGPLINAQMSNVENYLQLANDFNQHIRLREENIMTDLVGHLKSSDRVVRLTAIRAFLRLARNRRNMESILAQEGVEALLFMISNTYPLIERQAIACAFQTLRVLMLDQDVNARLWENDVADAIVGLALEFKSGTGDLFDNLLLLLCDMVDARAMLRGHPQPWVPSAGVYDAFLFAIVNCGPESIRVRGFRTLTGMLCASAYTAWTCFYEGDTNRIITACSEAISSTNFKLVAAAIDFLRCAIALVGESLFRRVQSVFELVAPELERVIDGKSAPLFSLHSHHHGGGGGSKRLSHPRQQHRQHGGSWRESRGPKKQAKMQVAHTPRAGGAGGTAAGGGGSDTGAAGAAAARAEGEHWKQRLRSQARELHEAYQRLLARMKATTEDKWRYTGPAGTQELLSMMVAPLDDSVDDDDDDGSGDDDDSSCGGGDDDSSSSSDGDDDDDDGGDNNESED